MCVSCDQAGRPSQATRRRGFLKAAGLIGTAAAASTLLAGGTAVAQPAGARQATGIPGRRTLIRGGAVLSMDSAVGDFDSADILIDGKAIAEVGRNLDVGDATVIDAAGMIVMPGFVDSHHHQFETALRGFLADGCC